MLVCLPTGPLGGVKFEGSALGSASGAFWRDELPLGSRQEHELATTLGIRSCFLCVPAFLFYPMECLQGGGCGWLWDFQYHCIKGLGMMITETNVGVRLV